DYWEEVPLMKTGVRILGVVVSFLMLVTGPLAPLAAAQQPSPPPAEPATQQPAPQPAASMAEPMPLNPRGSDSVAYNVGAGIANVVYVPGDRKSTRLNSSHDQISYAVFCLKKKKKKTNSVVDVATGV